MDIYIISFLISYLSAIVLYIFFIPLFHLLGIGQLIRIEGPQEHQKKQGTPTMGGIVIVFSALISLSLFTFLLKNITINIYFLLITPLLFYSLIGFLDDYLIIVKKNNLGLKGIYKLTLQILAGIIYFFIFSKSNFSTEMQIFSYVIDLKYLYFLYVIFIFTYSSNAVNLTDGLDGLASGLVIISLFCFIILSFHLDNLEIGLFGVILIGAILGFLCFNFYPSKIMMGDSGSLSLGATLANISILLKIEVLLIIIGFVFLLETLSVVMQVSYFKISKGKRIFLMSPLHHHFELKGNSEIKVNLIFWFFGLLFGCIGILLGVLYY